MSRREIALNPYVWRAVGAAFAIFSLACLAMWIALPPFDRPRTLFLAGGLATVSLALALSPAPRPDSRWTHVVIALTYLCTSGAICLLAPEGIAALPAAVFVGPLAALWLEDIREIVAHYLAATIALLAPSLLGLTSLDTFVATCTLVPPTFVLGFCCWYVLDAAEDQGDRLDALVKRDPLTGVGNRRLLDERLAAELARHGTTRHPLSVFALDLDGFKAVNDELGHAAGDQLLTFVGARLEAVAGPRATVARQGGDEFCVVMPETDAAGARSVGQQLREALAPAVSSGIGHATFPDDGREPQQLLALADARLVAGKSRRAPDSREAADGVRAPDLAGIHGAIDGMREHDPASDLAAAEEAASEAPRISRTELGRSVLIWRITGAMFIFYALAGAAATLWAPQLSGPLFAPLFASGALVGVWIACTRPPTCGTWRSDLVTALSYVYPVLAVLTCRPGGAVAIGAAVFPGALAAMRSTTRLRCAAHLLTANALFAAVAVSGTVDAATAMALLVLIGTTTVMGAASTFVFEAAEAQGAELEKLAVVDPLTGLANRRQLDAALTEQIRRCSDEGTPLSLLLLDLNGFKALNDGAGHGEGDALLVDVAEALRSAVGLPSVIARPGGDEFTVVLPGRDAAEADRLAHAIRSAISRLSRAAHPISTGIGRSTLGEDGADGPTLLRIADRRLLDDKYGERSAA